MPDDLPLAQQPGRLTVPDGNQDVWDDGLLRWDIFHALVWAGTVVLVWADWPSVTQRIAATAALAAMAVLYLLAGRRLMQAEADTRAGLAYLAVLIVLFTVAQSQDLNSWLVAFALCPHCFHVAAPRAAIGAAVAVNVIGGSLLIYRSPGQPYLTIALAFTAFGIVGSVAVGGYVIRIVHHAREQDELIRQLQATREELAGANHEAGMLAERQRLAGEIHDTIAQGCTSIVMLIQAAGSEIGRDPGAARRHLALAEETARENLAEARALVTALAPAQLDGGKLDDALRRLANQAAALLGGGADFEVGGSPRPLATTAEVMLLRVCQEALANVRKHASARRAWVRLSYHEDEVRLEIGDDGSGFDPACANGGYGLRGMRARVAEAGGSLTVRSAPGAGTSVSVEVPS
ncbi:MAG TPA: sensor histidine kinase [Streptosporangiaceae bacterium]|nr:sensor histidine kinase [Streptosporangiaceae bacterium]